MSNPGTLRVFNPDAAAKETGPRRRTRIMEIKEKDGVTLFIRDGQGGGPKLEAPYRTYFIIAPTEWKLGRNKGDRNTLILRGEETRKIDAATALGKSFVGEDGFRVASAVIISDDGCAYSMMNDDEGPGE